MREIICEVCGKKFCTAAPNAKYCSLECKDKAAKKHRKAWIKKNPKYNSDYYKAKNGTVKDNIKETQN